MSLSPDEGLRLSQAGIELRLSEPLGNGALSGFKTPAIEPFQNNAIGTVLKPNEVVTVHTHTIISDADGTIYETEEGLYGNHQACYARVVRDCLRHLPGLQEICADDASWQQLWDAIYNFPGEEAGRSFRDCLKRGLLGDVDELALFLEKYFARTNDPELGCDKLFSVHRGVFLKLVQQVQDDDQAFGEMLRNCHKIPYIDRLLHGALAKGIPMAVCSAAPSNNTERALAHFTFDDSQVPQELQKKPLRDVFDVVKGDSLKVSKDTDGMDLWEQRGVKAVAKQLKKRTRELTGQDIKRKGMIMLGDTMSDVGAAMVNGLAAVVIRVPEGPDRPRTLAKLERKIAELYDRQGELVEGIAERKDIRTKVIIVSCWSQVQFEKLSAHEEVAVHSISTLHA